MFSIHAQQAEVADGAFTQLEPVKLYENGSGPGWQDWVGNLGIEEEGVLGGPAGAIYNVSVPTYIPYLPDAERNTGTAVIVAPGGGFRLLAMAHEGHQVAQWLAERGIAAFVLKYRLVQMNGLQDFGAAMQRLEMDVASTMGVADGIRAVTMIRERAEDYRINPERIGIVGFSAGAHVAIDTATTTDLNARVNFAAPIYGAPFGETPAIPATDSEHPLPPFFLAMAIDDSIVAVNDVVAFAKTLFAAGYTPELHLYKDGSHGFGMAQQGTGSDLWIEQFFWWLKTQNLARKPGDPEHEINMMPPPDLGE